MFWFLLSKSTYCYVSFWASIYFALTRHWARTSRAWCLGTVSFKKASVSSSHLGNGEPIRIPRMESAFRSNSRDKERHTLNFQARHWYHLTVLTGWNQDFVSCQLLLPGCSNSPLHQSTCLFILYILFHLPLSFTCFLLPRLLSNSVIALRFFCKQKEK